MFYPWLKILSISTAGEFTMWSSLRLKKTSENNLYQGLQSLYVAKRKGIQPQLDWQEESIDSPFCVW